jgi:hypothetical protein
MAELADLMNATVGSSELGKVAEHDHAGKQHRPDHRSATAHQRFERAGKGDGRAFR